METTLTILASIVLGISLAASCGLRAFLPLFVVGLLARFTDLVDLGDAFEWLSTGPALVALGVGVLAEVLADKVPALNHLLDALQTPVRTGAGMLITAAVIVDLPTWMVALLAIIVGGGVALAVHTAKSTVRLGATASSAGTLNPLASLLEDVACLVTTVLCVFAWIVALIVAAIGLFVLYVSASALWRRR
jgi:hypothetical protein